MKYLVLRRSLEGYNNFIGLTKLVHSTVYGDDSNPVTFPGVGAAGIQFAIKAPTVEEITFNIDVTLAEGVSISNVKDDIISAITGYVNDSKILGIGGDVILAEVINRIMEINNVTDVSITAPAANVPIDESKGELARTRENLISIG